jgi:hypothetical protein
LEYLSIKQSQYHGWELEPLAPNRGFEQGKCVTEVQDKIMGGSQNVWLPPKILRRAKEINRSRTKLSYLGVKYLHFLRCLKK